MQFNVEEHESKLNEALDAFESGLTMMIDSYKSQLAAVQKLRDVAVAAVTGTQADLAALAGQITAALADVQTAVANGDEPGRLAAMQRVADLRKQEAAARQSAQTSAAAAMDAYTAARQKIKYREFAELTGQLARRLFGLNGKINALEQVVTPARQRAMQPISLPAAPAPALAPEADTATPW